MEETLEKVLRKLVIPINDRMVDVKVRRMKNSFDDYMVNYFINDRIDYRDGSIIEKESRDLFNMLGPKQGSQIIINYTMIDED